MAKSQIWFGFALLALLLVSAVADDVVVLTDDSFEKEVGKDKGALVEFYAPWYGSILSIRMRSFLICKSSGREMFWSVIAVFWINKHDFDLYVLLRN